MPIVHTYSGNEITIFTIIAEVTFADIMATLETIYKRNPTPNIMWDIREGTAVNLTYDHLTAIADYIVKVSEKRRGGKTALVALHDAEYGVSRTLDTLAKIKEIPFAIEVFRDYKAALNWLESEEF